MPFTIYPTNIPGSNDSSELAQMLFKDRQLRADRNLRQQQLNQNAIRSIFNTFNQTMAIVSRNALGEERNKILQDAAQSRFTLGLVREQRYSDEAIAKTEKAMDDRIRKVTGEKYNLDTFMQLTAKYGLDPQEALGEFAAGKVFGFSPEQEQTVAAHNRQKELVQNDPDFGQGANHPDALQVQNAANSVIDQNIARASKPGWYKPKTPALDAFRSRVLTDEQADGIGLPTGEDHLWMLDDKGNAKDVLGEIRREDAKVAREAAAQQAKDAALEIKADERQVKADEKEREDAPAVLNGITLQDVKASELEDLRSDELKRRIKHNEKVEFSFEGEKLPLDIGAIDKAVEQILRLTDRESMAQFDKDVVTRKEDKARRNLSLEQRILDDMKAKTRLEQRIVNHTNRLLEPDLPPVEKEHILDELEELLRQQANAE